MLKIFRKVLIVLKYPFFMNRVLSKMEVGDYEGAIKEIDNINSSYIQTEAMLIKCYALEQLGCLDLIEKTTVDALKGIEQGKYSALERIYINAYAQAVCPSIVNSAYFEPYDLDHLKSNIRNVSSTLRRALPLKLS